ncbi:hypothetical protein Desaci_0191 [Desulfosporosinus acidiphilus SJ4]|uniref:Uncharacterized protein n=1 Tax=Desulfosporosinus acidiphilus (strain DSM 22704 / JCM 16185 / SJ4) TaxID=646529 RepID=I4D0E3_DESAJ|nr:hypothetical protein Desaci_0191 [Desulfosporosinus acidiphilus SJ4]
MRRLRDVSYINAFPENNEIVYYGLQLKEFIKYAPVELNQLLLLEAEYYGKGGLRSATKFEIVEKDIPFSTRHKDQITVLGGKWFVNRF